MSLTANFDYCIQFSLNSIKAIFHLALKNEALFPHNVGPFERVLSGQHVSIQVALLDDHDNPADLAFQDEKHILFTLPLRLTVQVPDSPDPSLAQIILKAAVTAPGALASWPVDGKDQLGVSFAGIAAGDVNVPTLDGLPTLDAARFEAAIHTKYDALPQHTFSLSGNVLVLYDGSRDMTLSPPNKPSNPAITATIEAHGGKQYLKVLLPIHANVPLALFSAYGMVTFWREIVPGDATVSVNMATEPGDAALATQIDFDGAHPAEGLVVTNLKPLVIGRLAEFGLIKEPWFTEAAAKELMKQEAASYLSDKKFPFYTPEAGDAEHPLSTPVGFLLPADGVLAVLMNRRDASVADFAPENFLGSRQIALAVGRAMLDQTISDAMNAKFPGVNNGGAEVEADGHEATLETLSVTPSDPGDHDEDEGHLWAEGEAEVHIDCWPDPDVSFHGPIFLGVIIEEDGETCSLTVQPRMGDFDASESCCDVFVDLIIPVVGIIMLIVIESMIDDIGGELADQFAAEQTRNINPIPSFVLGVAELQACLEDLKVSSKGLVFPGKMRIRREGRSYEDLADSGDLPRP